MTKQEFLELYGKSVYQVRLEIASQMWCREPTVSPDYCLTSADDFLEALLKEDVKQLERSL
jgi:hypothetical protein